MNVNPYNTTDYENISNWTLGESKPNSNPIKPNFQKAKMNVNLTLTKDYRKNVAFVVRKNKPNSNPISSKAKMNLKSLATRDYVNKANFRLEQNKPKQSQWIGSELKSPIFTKLTKYPIYQRSYPAMRLNVSVDTLAQIWNLSMFHSIISH